MFRPYQNYRTLRRYRQIILTLGRYGFGELIGRLNLLNLLKLKKTTVTPEHKGPAPRAVRFRLMLEQLGPTFIKLGQILSTRADLLPHDVVLELANLQDRVTPTPWRNIIKGLPDQLNHSFDNKFAEFNTEPIASASIAQVYAARLKSGEKVAVKIVRPGTEATFKDDLMILEHLASLAQTHLEEARRWDIHALVDQLRSSVNYELDLRHEGRNADIFRTNFADDPTVYVPKIYWEHTSRHVLVMEFIDGKPIADFFLPHADPQTRKILAQNGAKIVLKQIFDFGFFQADPHPGNAFVMDGNVICFLDFGMFGRLEPQALNILGRVLQAAAKKDIDRLFKAARDLGVLPDSTKQTQMRVAVLDLIEQYHGVPLRQVNVPQLLRDIVRLVSHYHVGIRHDFLFLIKALGIIEATGRKLDPDFDMLTHAEPFIRSMVTRRLSPRHVLDETQRFSEDVVQLTRESPEHLLEILRKASAGKLKLEFQHEGLERPFAQLNQMSDKLVLGLIIAALIIASALMARSGIGPSLLGYPVIGGVAFLIAGVTGLWIIFDILRTRKR